jgi:hypothetical protein
MDLTSEGRKMTKKIETGIVLTGNAKLGSALLEEAAKLNQEKVQKRVVSTLSQLLEQIEVQRTALAVLEKQAECLNKGEFILDRDGVITYTDPELNKLTVALMPCTQCGYTRMVKGSLR